MDGANPWVGASRHELLRYIERLEQIVVAQREQIAQLRGVIADLDRQLAERQLPTDSGTPEGMPGHKPTSPAPKPTRPRKKRLQNFARRRGTPTAVVVHVVATCPDCGTALRGGWVRRHREVIDLPPGTATVTDHVYLERQCPGCGRRVTPAPDLQGVVVGQQRFGLGLLSLIVTLREVGRWPNRTIQWYLKAVHGVDVSLGAIVAAQQQVATVGKLALEQLLVDIRGSPVLHADETGLRENGHNGYAWIFCTPDTTYFIQGRRDKTMVDIVIDGTFTGTLVSDGYAAYDHYEGLHQRCWAHVLRHVHDVRIKHLADEEVQAWASGIHTLYLEAVAVTHADPAMRQRHKQDCEQRLRALCAPVVGDETAPHRKLCTWLCKYLSELFVFVVDPAVPPDNSDAERGQRHLVIFRKISGGTRSPVGTKTKMALASLFGTWRRRRLDPLAQCHDLLRSAPD